MNSLWMELSKKAKRAYHQMLHAYHAILYQDCRDQEMKHLILKKMQYHKQKL